MSHSRNFFPTTRLVACLFLLTALPDAYAEVVFDGSMNPPQGPASTGTTLSGAMVIPANWGTQSGGNLFHSFSAFGIKAGESVTFTDSGAITTVERVIGRVTGDNLSLINGPLTSTIADADLYLLNPNGIVFGADASIDIKGSFHAASADYLQLGDQRFQAASTSSGALLSSAAPIAFGFLSAGGDIRIDGGHLAVNGPHSLTFTANNVQIGDGGSLSADAGNIDIRGLDQVILEAGATLATTASDNGNAGSLSIAANRIVIDGSQQPVQLSAQAAVGNSGDIRLLANDQLSLQNADITIHQGSEAYGQSFDTSAGSLRLAAGGAVSITDSHLLNESYSFSFATDSGKPDIAIGGEHIAIAGSSIDSNSYDAALAGRIALTATNRLTVTDSRIASLALLGIGNGLGDAGNIALNAERGISLLNSQIVSDANVGQANGIEGGYAGSIVLTATNGDIVVADSYLSGQTGQRLGGIAGAIALNALNIDVTASELRTDKASGSTSEQDEDGRISLSATTDVKITDSRISSSNQINEISSGGAAGHIGIAAGHDVVIARSRINSDDNNYGSGDGERSAGKITVAAGHDLGIGDDSLISTITRYAGQAGDITLSATGDLRIRDSTISSDNLWVEPAELALVGGKAGDIAVQAGRDIGLSHVVVSSDDNNGGMSGYYDVGGLGGNVALSAGRDLRIGESSRIGTSTYAGIAGGIGLAAAGNLAIADSEIASNNRLNFYSYGGQAGDIAITVGGNLSVANTAIASDDDNLSSDWVWGAAGSVSLNAGGRIAIVRDSRVSTDTLSGLAGGVDSNGIGKGVIVNAGGSIRVADSEISSKNRLNDYYWGGLAGKVSVTAGSGIILDAATIVSSDENRGAAGDVEISSGFLSLRNASSISSSAQSPIKSGNVVIRATRINVAQGSSISAANNFQPGADEILLPGDAMSGTILITALDSLNLQNAVINVATSVGDAGDINIAAGRLLYLLDSAITTSAAAGFGRGGNIAIDPVFVVLNNSQIIAQALRGDGGNISVVADFILPSIDSSIDASSQLGVDGKVSLQAQYANIAGSIGVLPSGLLDTANLLRDDCSVTGKLGSSFVVHNRGHLPQTPDNWLMQGFRSVGCDG